MIKNRLIWTLLFFCLTFSVSAQVLKTPAEECNYTRYSQNEEIARFLSLVSNQAKNVTIQVTGKSRAVENYPTKNLFLCIITKEQVCTPGQLDHNKPTILLTASQHGDEQSAKEAALQLIRDLAVGDLQPLLDKVNVLVIPQTNPFGNAFDQRENELELDMNRDHIKLEAEGVQTIHRIFRTWMPEVTLDVHERGDNYYRVSMGCVSNINLDPVLQDYSRQHILAGVEQLLKEERIPFHEYLVTEEMGINTAAGAQLRPEDTAGRQMLMRYSTTDINDGRNSLGIYQTFSFIQEGASRSNLETLKERTRWQALCLRAFVQIVADHGAEILDTVQSLRQRLLQQSKIFSEENQIHLKMQYSRDGKNPTLNLRELARTDSLVTGIMKSDIKSGDLLLASDVAPYPYPAKQKIVSRVISNWFPLVVPTLSVSRPLGYVIPADHGDVIETLLQHGVAVSLFMQDCQIQVEGYWVSEVTPAKYDYLPPEKIEVVRKSCDILCKRGDFFVSCCQPAANLLPCLLEPQSDYGMIRYWKYRLTPEKGNFFAFYRVIKEQSLSVIPYQNWTR
jgi:hypothetical protein